jgi:membrane protein
VKYLPEADIRDFIAAAREQLPLERWRSLGARVYRQFNDDRIMAVAGGVVFYALLGIFPAITAFVSFYGLFSDPTTVTAHLALVEELLPTGAINIIRDQAMRAAEGGTAQLGLASIAALLFAIWCANSGTKSIIDALNIVYGEKETRSFLKLNLVSLLLTLGAMAALLLAVGAVIVIPLLLAAFGVGSVGELEVLRWPLLVVLVLMGLAALYRFGPNRSHARWRWLSAGAATAAIAWLASSALFSWYLSNFANYNAIYGSLGAVIGLMMWMWVSTIVILLGAELDAEIAREIGNNRQEPQARKNKRRSSNAE